MSRGCSASRRAGTLARGKIFGGVPGSLGTAFSPMCGDADASALWNAQIPGKLTEVRWVKLIEPRNQLGPSSDNGRA